MRVPANDIQSNPTICQQSIIIPNQKPLISYDDPRYRCGCSDCEYDGVMRLWRTFVNEKRIVLGCAICIAKKFNDGISIPDAQTAMPPFNSRLLEGKIYMPAIIDEVNGGYYLPGFRYLTNLQLKKWQDLLIIGSLKIKCH